MSVLELFCHVDTFCHAFLPHWNQELRAHGQRTHQRTGQVAMSEIMTILISSTRCAFVRSKPGIRRTSSVIYTASFPTPSATRALSNSCQRPSARAMPMCKPVMASDA